MSSKSPVLAAVLSFFLPGVGHFYCGSWKRGALFLFAGVAAFALKFVVGPFAGKIFTFAVDAWAAYDAWHLAVPASAPGADSAEAAPAPAAEPPGPLLWTWALVRALWISGTVLFFGGVGVGGIVVAMGSGAYLGALTSTAPAALLFVLCWLAGRSTWRVMKGVETVSPSAVRAELAAAILGVSFAAAMLAIVWPSFSQLVRKSAEGDMKGSLGLMRDAAQRGVPPPVVPDLWKQGKQPHPRTNETITLPDATPTDSGKWASVAGSSTTIFIDCTHTDSRGTAWNSY